MEYAFYCFYYSYIHLILPCGGFICVTLLMFGLLCLYRRRIAKKRFAEQQCQECLQHEYRDRKVMR